MDKEKCSIFTGWRSFVLGSLLGIVFATIFHTCEHVDKLESKIDSLKLQKIVKHDTIRLHDTAWIKIYAPQ